MATRPIYIPVFIANDKYEPARIQPRLFFYNGVLSCEAFFLSGYSSGTNIVTNQFTAFPYLDHYSTGSLSGSEQLPNTGSESLLFLNETPPYGIIPENSLYTKYWETYISLLYNPRTRLINISAIIPIAEYIDLELNDLVQFRGNTYHLRAINDYNLNTGKCTVQLLGPILPDAING